LPPGSISCARCSSIRPSRADEVRRRRDEQAADIVAALESPSAIADQCYAGFLYGAHPYGRPIEGLSASVPKLGRGDVRDFYERWYRPNDTILVLVGDVAAAEATVRLREAFGAWRPRADAVAVRAAPPARLTARRVLLVDKPDATQTQIRLGNVAIARSDPSYVPAIVANTILGGGFTSQLIEELRIKAEPHLLCVERVSWRGSRRRLPSRDVTKTPTTTETLALALSVEGEFRSHPPARRAPRQSKDLSPRAVSAPHREPRRARRAPGEAEFNALGPEEPRHLPRAGGGSDARAGGEVAAKLMPPPERSRRRGRQGRRAPRRPGCPVWPARDDGRQGLREALGGER